MKNNLEKKIFLSPPHLNGEEINFIQEAIKLECSKIKKSK